MCVGGQESAFVTLPDHQLNLPSWINITFRHIFEENIDYELKMKHLMARLIDQDGL